MKRSIWLGVLLTDLLPHQSHAPWMPHLQPKHARSITKRELLRKALGLDKAAVFWKKQNPDSEAIPSTLEVWVNYQVAKVGGAPEPMATKVCCSKSIGG